MKGRDRYDTSGLEEAQFGPGSRRRVLRNLLGIKSSRRMDDTEASSLKAAMEFFVATYDEQHRFTAGDICKMHRRWLGRIYAWAGAYRQVNVSKNGFPFAAANRVPALMDDYGRKVLPRYLPVLSTGALAALDSRLSVRAIVSAFRPVSIEVLLETLVISPLRRVSASRR